MWRVMWPFVKWGSFTAIESPLNSWGGESMSAPQSSPKISSHHGFYKDVWAELWAGTVAICPNSVQSPTFLWSDPEEWKVFHKSQSVKGHDGRRQSNPLIALFYKDIEDIGVGISIQGTKTAALWQFISIAKFHFSSSGTWWEVGYKDKCLHPQPKEEVQSHKLYSEHVEGQWGRWTTFQGCRLPAAGLQNLRNQSAPAKVQPIS